MSDSTRPEPFSHYVDTRKVFSQKGIFEGPLAKERLERLRELAVEGPFAVEAHLEFSLDKRGRRLIEGWAKATVAVACQRCLQPLELAVADDIRLALVSDEEKAAALDEDVEPWIESEFRLDPASIVEEQLLLAMPLVAYHEQQDCTIRSPSETALQGSVAHEKDDSPFAVLRELKLSEPKH